MAKKNVSIRGKNKSLMFDFIKRFFDAEESQYNLRPPGALKENIFLAKCIKCGRCMEACPYQSIKLASYVTGFSYATPFIAPVKKPCYLCMRCPEVCPTGALITTEKEKVKMGTAYITKKSCFAYLDTVCTLCFRHCPLKNSAIKMDFELKPIIDEDACTGCGVCLFVCPTKEKSIYIKAQSA